MEQLNRIELRGKVGNVYLYSNGNTHNARFGLVTNYAYKSKKGEPVIETFWHNVVAWEGKGVVDLRSLEKGQIVYVCGRLRQDKYTNSDGVERQTDEVIAREVRIENATELSPQMDF